MPKVNLQFHGTTTEIEAWASGWAAEHNLCLVLERFFPQKRYVVVADGAIAEAAQKLDGAWDRMWLFLLLYFFFILFATLSLKR